MDVHTAHGVTTVNRFLPCDEVRGNVEDFMAGLDGLESTEGSDVEKNMKNK